MGTRPIVFIIDDDPAALSSVEALFTAYEYEVRSFDSAEAFLAAYEQTDFGCLLSDVRLPRMSGLELNATLKLKGISLPVILISGYTGSEVAAEAIKNGVIAFLAKPVKSDVLVGTVEKAIRMHRQT